MAKQLLISEIRKVGAAEKVAILKGTVEGAAVTLKCWTSAFFFSELTEGASVDITTEEKDNDYQGQITKERWLTSVNGKPEKEVKSFGKGGGGGRPYTPKSPTEIAVPLMGEIVKACAGMTTNPDAFAAMIGKVTDAVAQAMPRLSKAVA